MSLFVFMSQDDRRTAMPQRDVFYEVLHLLWALVTTKHEVAHMPDPPFIKNKKYLKSMLVQAQH